MTTGIAVAGSPSQFGPTKSQRREHFVDGAFRSEGVLPDQRNRDDIGDDGGEEDGSKETPKAADTGVEGECEREPECHRDRHPHHDEQEGVENRATKGFGAEQGLVVLEPDEVDGEWISQVDPLHIGHAESERGKGRHGGEGDENQGKRGQEDPRDGGVASAPGAPR